MIEGWESKRLDELGAIGRGKSRHRPRNAPHLYGGDYPFIQTGDIQNAGFRILEYKNTYSNDGLAQSKLWKKNTLCISIVGANTAETALLGFDACFPDSVIGFNAFPDKADNYFMKYYLDTMKLQMKKISEGAARENLSMEKLLSIKMLTPPLTIQKKIAGILSAYDDLIENNLKRIKLLEEMAQITYEEWFLRLRFSGDDSTPITPETGLPDGWRKGTMSDLITFKNGHAFKSNTYIQNGKYKVVTIKNVQDGKFIPNTTDTIAELPNNIKPHQHLSTSDIIMSLTGNVGRVCLVYGDNYLLNQRVAKIEPKHIDDLSYVYVMLRNKGLLTQLENISNGAAQQNLSPVNASKLSITIPSREVLDKFNKSYGKIIEIISMKNIENQRLREARDILLPRLMTGMIDVEEYNPSELLKEAA